MSTESRWFLPGCGISGTSQSASVPKTILGIDPGLRRTGFGLIRQTGQKLEYLGSGLVVTGSEDLPIRLGIIFDGVAEVVETYQPTVACIEKVFVNVNPQSTLLLGQARGAAITALVRGGLAVHEYTALQLKKSVTGHGHADKHQIQAMIKRLLKLAAEPSEDAADALACAICHANSDGLTSRLQGSGQALRVRGGRLV